MDFGVLSVYGKLSRCRWCLTQNPAQLVAGSAGFRPGSVRFPSVPGDGRRWGEAGVAADRREEKGGERKWEREKERSGRTRGERKRKKKPVHFDRSDPVRFDSRYKILNFYSALGPKTRPKISKKNSRKLRKIRRLQIYF